MPTPSQPADAVPPRSGGRFTRKFVGAPVQITFRLDAHRKQKVEAHAKQRGCEVADLIRLWLYPVIDGLPDAE